MNLYNYYHHFIIIIIVIIIMTPGTEAYEISGR